MIELLSTKLFFAKARSVAALTTPASNARRSCRRTVPKVTEFKSASFIIPGIVNPMMHKMKEKTLASARLVMAWNWLKKIPAIL